MNSVVPTDWRTICDRCARRYGRMLGLMMTLALMMGLQDPASSQSSEPSRTEALDQARQDKAGKLEKPTRTLVERALQQFKEKRVMERFQEGFHGFHPMVGGIVTGSGF